MYTTVSCSHVFEEGALQIQTALSKSRGWWEGGNTSSVDLLLTMESHGRTQIKPRYKHHSAYTKTLREHKLSISLLLISFFCPVPSFTCTHSTVLLTGWLHTSLCFFIKHNILVIQDTWWLNLARKGQIWSVNSPRKFWVYGTQTALLIKVTSFCI